MTDSGGDPRGTPTGGTLVALSTIDGVLMAADTRTSQGRVVRSDSVEKISPVHPTAAMGSTGDPAVVQSFVRAVRSAADSYERSPGEPMDISALSTVAATELRDRSMTEARFLLGGVDDDSAHVFTLGQDEGALEDSYAVVRSD